MSSPHRDKLEKLGLSPTEAGIYLTLLRNRRAMGASAIAAATEMARSSVYPALSRLTDLGLVEAEAGYGSGFTAVPPVRGLGSLITRETEELSDRKRLARELVGQLESLAEPIGDIADAEQIQVIRDPRVATDRFERLQLEAEREIDLFVKYPIFNVHQSNPGLSKALERGVRYRSLYEQQILDAPEVRPYLSDWIAAGEEARVYKGELPHKLAIFDRQFILLPLVTLGRPTRTLFIKHPQLATSLTLLFESFWADAEAMVSKARSKRRPGKKEEADAQAYSARRQRAFNHQTNGPNP